MEKGGDRQGRGRMEEEEGKEEEWEEVEKEEEDGEVEEKYVRMPRATVSQSSFSK